MKRIWTLPAWFSIACVWFGMHAGGGFASGQQEVRYFILFGATAVLMPFVTVLIQGVANFFAWDFARLTKSYDYRSWVNRFYYPFDKIFANILDILFVVFLCLPSGAAIAGAASLMQQEFGLNYVLGTVIACGILFFCSIFGSELVRRASAIMSVVLVTFLAIVVIYGISSTFDRSAQVISEVIVSQDFSWFDAFKMAVLYASFQASVSVLISVAEPLKTRKDVFKTVLAGVLINGIALALVCWMLLGAYPEVLSKDIPLPVLHMLNTFDLPILKVCYSVALFFAFISTGVVFVFASVRRFEKSRIWNRAKPEGVFGRSLQARGVVIAIITILYALGVSQFGLVAIVARGYSYMGWAYLVMIIIPLIIFGRYKCKRAEQGLENH